MRVPFVKCPCANAECKLGLFSYLHGKRSGYTVNRCRCSACLEANRLYLREYEARRNAHNGDPIIKPREGKRCECGNPICRLSVDDERHGTAMGYKYHCGCEPCRLAANLARKEHRLGSGFPQQRYLMEV